jgi:hypothetical protein
MTVRDLVVDLFTEHLDAVTDRPCASGRWWTSSRPSTSPSPRRG